MSIKSNAQGDQQSKERQKQIEAFYQLGLQRLRGQEEPVIKSWHKQARRKNSQSSTILASNYLIYSWRSC
jgi:hypothetical protein